MLRSMYSGISGLRNFQTKLDVIGNNIANVNTFGFKKGRVVFQDIMSQTVAGTSAPGENRGGTNAKQIGLGSTLAAIDTIHEGGSAQSTGRGLDLSIDGDGYFIVNDGAQDLYTRAGNFYLDRDGNLVNSNGLFVVGEGDAKITIPPEAKSFSIGQDGAVTYVPSDSETPETAGIIQLAKFPNTGGLMKVGNNLFTTSSNSNEGDVLKGNPGAAETGTGRIIAGRLEMSNVDLSEEFTEMIVAQRGFQANTRIITTSDEILQELVNLKR